MSSVAEMLVDAIAGLGVRSVWGVVGDALNPITDAIRRDERLEWIGVRHEEVGAFAAGAQAQLTGTPVVCMGTVGPGSLHLLTVSTTRASHTPRHAREQVLALADRLAAPTVLTLKAKEGLERDNRFEVGQSGLIGNPAAQHAFESCDLLLMLGTDFPYSDWDPTGKRVVQVDHRESGHLKRRPDRRIRTGPADP
jgi:thiamine pyrophosphate-dependent acetolactate synthase large subunit-like protein